MRDSYIRKYKRPNFGLLTRQYNVKLSEDMADQLEALAKELNVTPPEVIRILLYEEFQVLRKEEAAEDTQGYLKISKDTYEYPKISSDIKLKEAPQARPQPSKPTSRSGGGRRFDTKRWQVSGETACPLCNSWHSSSNFSRHLKRHHGGISSEEVFSNPDHAAIADKMVEQRKKAGY
ncbi:hypothetical protein [Laceyella sacchari]|uniref:C2H2-type domain-containing protein n=1 Tax=Laceyella sacchari TaxID=37482 RepID=A0ABY5U821_LACSH|nr:hypothetical protein [Laceyella sacchari]UWE05314.1 hypothetical protein NYR52_16480 [Laceyella sacchari]